MLEKCTKKQNTIHYRGILLTSYKTTSHYQKKWGNVHVDVDIWSLFLSVYSICCHLDSLLFQIFPLNITYNVSFLVCMIFLWVKFSRQYWGLIFFSSPCFCGQGSADDLCPENRFLECLHINQYIFLALWLGNCYQEDRWCSLYKLYVRSMSAFVGVRIHFMWASIFDLTLGMQL